MKQDYEVKVLVHQTDRVVFASLATFLRRSLHQQPADIIAAARLPCNARLEHFDFTSIGAWLYVFQQVMGWDDARLLQLATAHAASAARMPSPPGAAQQSLDAGDSEEEDEDDEEDSEVVASAGMARAASATEGGDDGGSSSDSDAETVKADEGGLGLWVRFCCVAVLRLAMNSCLEAMGSFTVGIGRDIAAGVGGRAAAYLTACGLTSVTKSRPLLKLNPQVRSASRAFLRPAADLPYAPFIAALF